MWQYTKQQQGEEGAPPVALKTRRSLRAVHFHPLGLPLVLTAEVNDVNTPVTLPHGALSPEAAAAEAAATAAAEAIPAQQQVPEGRPHRVQFADGPQEFEAQHAHEAQRPQPHRRLSEVFRAMMDEEHEEELLAQLETSVSLHTGQPPASASRQILHMTGRGDHHHRHDRWQADPQPSRQSLDTPLYGAAPLRHNRVAQPAFHPLAHTEHNDLHAFRVSLSWHRRLHSHSIHVDQNGLSSVL